MRAIKKVPIVLFFFGFAFCTDFHVGPTQTYSSILGCYSLLSANDRLFIHYQSTPYYEKFVVPYNNISIIGVPNSNGDLPILDGNGATTPTSNSFTNGQRGLIKIGTSSTTQCPEDTTIENLHLRNAHPDYSFTDSSSSSSTYVDNAASVYIECAKRTTIRNNIITGSGNGIFVGLFYGSGTEDTLIEGNQIYGNGVVGSYLQHNTYTSSIGIIYQHNYFGPLCDGCDGNNLKDRSSGCVIRYNYIVDGNRQCDLVDAGDLASLSEYHQTYVYGNVLYEETESGNRQIIHYGGDSGTTANYRKGTLYFHYNTVISKRPSGYAGTLVRLSSDDESIDARNNVLYFTQDGTNRFEIFAEHRGTASLSYNLLKSGWMESVENTYSGTFTQTSDYTYTELPPFFDLGNGDFRFSNQSFFNDRPAGSLSSQVIAADHIPKKQYNGIASYIERSNVNEQGAFAFNANDTSNDNNLNNNDNDDDGINALQISFSIVASILVIGCCLLCLVVGIAFVLLMVFLRPFRFSQKMVQKFTNKDIDNAINKETELKKKKNEKKKENNKN